MKKFFDVIGNRLAAVRATRAPTGQSSAYRCACGQPVFLGNRSCVTCGAPLGFDPNILEVRALIPAEVAGTWHLAAPGDPDESPQNPFIDPTPAAQATFRRCANFETVAACNWLVPTTDADIFCVSCRLNKLIPDLSLVDNQARWRKLEIAKRQMVAQLLTLGLEVRPQRTPGDGGLAFELIGPDMNGKLPLTGHDAGLITINVLEADDPYRAKLREDMNEPYRTLLGHFRHEVGHYYWDRLVLPGPWLAPFREVFGDERADYSEALKRNYENGPPADWAQRFISTYAACHPWEDWAETWAHYLHMMDTLDTAINLGISTRAVERDYVSFEREVLYAPDAPDADSFLDLVNAWVELTGVLNELSRSMGQRDFYPFVLPHAVVGKLQFVHRVVKAYSVESSAPVTPAF